MTDLLHLERRLNRYECDCLIRFIASSEKDMLLRSEIIKFLVLKSEMPGSGVATTLSCDLTGFSWSNLFRVGYDLDLETVQAIMSLKGIISYQDIDVMIQCLKCSASNVALLKYALDHAPKLKDASTLINLCKNAMICNKAKFFRELMSFSVSASKFDAVAFYSLCKEAMRLNRVKYIEEVLSYSLSQANDSSKLVQQALKEKNMDLLEELKTKSKEAVDPVHLVNKMNKTDLQTRKKLISYIMSTPEGCAQLFLKAVGYFEYELAEKCLADADVEAVRNNVGLTSVLRYLNQGNSAQRKEHIQFIKKLLELGFDPNGRDGEEFPLDAVLKLSSEYHSEKNELLMLLLQYNVRVKSCILREKGTTLLHEATTSAIDFGK